MHGALGSEYTSMWDVGAMDLSVKIIIAIYLYIAATREMILKTG